MYAAGDKDLLSYTHFTIVNAMTQTYIRFNFSLRRQNSELFSVLDLYKVTPLLELTLYDACTPNMLKTTVVHLLVAKGLTHIGTHNGTDMGQAATSTC
jgi:hypothetical protein